MVYTRVVKPPCCTKKKHPAFKHSEGQNSTCAHTTRQLPTGYAQKSRDWVSTANKSRRKGPSGLQCLRHKRRGGAGTSPQNPALHDITAASWQRLCCRIMSNCPHLRIMVQPTRAIPHPGTGQTTRKAITNAPGARETTCVTTTWPYPPTTPSWERFIALCITAAATNS